MKGWADGADDSADEPGFSNAGINDHRHGLDIADLLDESTQVFIGHLGGDEV